MNQLYPVTLERHAGKGWRQPDSLLYAAQSQVAKLVLREFATTQSWTCCAFMADSEGYAPVALLGLGQEQNLFVNATGGWLGRTVPRILMHYPFKLGKVQDERLILCIDESSGLLTEMGQGHPLFAEDGKPTEPAQTKANELIQYQQELQATRAQCVRLDSAGLLEPWPLKVQNEQGTRTLDGLFRINEAALAAMPAPDFAALREGGALVLAYGQLFSMQHAPTLGQLARLRAQARIQPQLDTAKTADLGNMFNTDNRTLSFDNL